MLDDARKSIYWDACVWLSYINEIPERMMQFSMIAPTLTVTCTCLLRVSVQIQGYPVRLGAISHRSGSITGESLSSVKGKALDGGCGGVCTYILRPSLRLRLHSQRRNSNVGDWIPKSRSELIIFGKIAER